MTSSENEHTMLGPSSEHEAGHDFTDARGRRWVAAERITPREVDILESEQVRRTPDPAAAVAPDPRTLSRDDLAHALQPRRLVGEYEYRLDEPDYEIADQILNMAQAPGTEGSWGDKSAYARSKYLTGPGFSGPPAMWRGRSGRRRSISGGGVQSGHSRF